MVPWPEQTIEDIEDSMDNIESNISEGSRWWSEPFFYLSKEV